MLELLLGGFLVVLYNKHEAQFKKAFGSKSEFQKLFADLWDKDVRGFRDFFAKVVATSIKAGRWSANEFDEFVANVRKHLEDDNSDTKPQPPDAA
jgi:hypothetical protein